MLSQVHPAGCNCLLRAFLGKEDPGLVPRVFHHFPVSWDRLSVFRGCPQCGVSLLPCLAGLAPLLHHVQRLVIVALMFVAVSATGFIILLCQLRERRFGECQGCTPAPQTKPFAPHRGQGRWQKASAKLLLPCCPNSLWWWEEMCSAHAFLLTPL